VLTPVYKEAEITGEDRIAILDTVPSQRYATSTHTGNDRVEKFFAGRQGSGSPMTEAAAWQRINEQWDVHVVGPPLEVEGTAPK
jgi:hypothetical protein